VSAVGFTLQPDEEFLERAAPLFEHADYFEVAPETLWFADARGSLQPNGFWHRFAALAERGRRFVAHGVGLSMGTNAASDRPRQRRWLERMAEDHGRFRFEWWTDHLGASSLDGLALTLPVALPMTPRAAAIVRGRLAQMQSIVGDVGVENTVAYFTLGDPLDEPRFLRACLRAPGSHLLLDLHNLYTMALNCGFAPEHYLDALPLERVIEIHLSGGSMSLPEWLPSGVSLRLDGHDDAVPEPVWALAEQIVPRCPSLRGITLERMEGTVAAADVARLGEELARARRLLP
jgi:uncharacterized protein (UPF0276 family)